MFGIFLEGLMAINGWETPQSCRLMHAPRPPSIDFLVFELSLLEGLCESLLNIGRDVSPELAQWRAHRRCPHSWLAAALRPLLAWRHVPLLQRSHPPLRA